MPSVRTPNITRSARLGLTTSSWARRASEFHDWRWPRWSGLPPMCAPTASAKLARGRFRILRGYPRPTPLPGRRAGRAPLGHLPAALRRDRHTRAARHRRLVRGARDRMGLRVDHARSRLCALPRPEVAGAGGAGALSCCIQSPERKRRRVFARSRCRRIKPLRLKDRCGHRRREMPHQGAGRTHVSHGSTDARGVDNVLL